MMVEVCARFGFILDLSGCLPQATAHTCSTNSQLVPLLGSCDMRFLDPYLLLKLDHHQCSS
ncbi:hypothetical protein ACRRTK_021646 [Alexandromys fortis]